MTGNTSATVNLAVASNDLVNGNDEITVTGTGTYNSADAGTNIPVTVSDIQATGAGQRMVHRKRPHGRHRSDYPGNPGSARCTDGNRENQQQRHACRACYDRTGVPWSTGYATDVEVEPDHWQTVATFTGLTARHDLHLLRPLRREQ